MEPIFLVLIGAFRILADSKILSADRSGMSYMPNRNLVLVVDDDPGMLKGIKRLLRQFAYDALLFPSAEAFKNHTDFEQAACVILDINLSDGSGIELRHRLKAAGFPCRLSTLLEMRTLPFARLRWPLDASHFLKSPSPRNRSLSRSRKLRQGVHRLRRSSIVAITITIASVVAT